MTAPRYLGRRPSLPPEDLRQRRLPLVATMIRACRMCGCTDSDPRFIARPGSAPLLFWVSQDLCGACAPRAA